MEEGFANDYRLKRLQNYRRVEAWMQGHETLAKFGAALVMALLTGALAQITIHTPLTPVPFTMQVFGIALMGGLLGRKWGVVSALLYVGLGVLGLPIFAGEIAAFDGWQILRFGMFTAGPSSWYLVGFIAQAFIVGAIADARTQAPNRALNLVAPLAVCGLLGFALLDAYYLSDYAAFYGSSAFPNVWFTLLSLGILVVVAGCTWLAFTHKARRERVELFFGNVVGILAMYAIGAIGFAFVWNQLGNGPLAVDMWLAYTVLPFIPVDLAKVLLAIGVLTLVRPTHAELAGAMAPEAPRTNV